MHRRTFLQIAGGTIIGGVAVRAGLAASSRAHAEHDVTPDRVVPTFCELCFWKCGVLASVKDGVVYKLEGNPKHPLANGKLCPRGTGGTGALYDPDRLKQPLVRERTADGEKWRAATWDEALDVVARRLREVKDKHGAASIALFSHGHGGSFWKTLLKGLGSTNIVAPSNDQCRGPREAGYKLTYGTPVGGVETIDVPNAKCIAFIGTHLGENMHNTAVQDVSHANAAGATFITVDPRYSIIASKSKYWLPIKPGTDTALLLAWAHVLIDEGIYQKEFVAKNCIGFEQLAAHVKDKTPEWAYLETGILPSVIRETARELAKNAPAALVHPGRHVVWYGNDTQRSRASAIVNALLGNWAKPGGFYLPSTIPLAPYPLPAAKGVAYKPRQAFPFGDEICAYDACDSSMSSTAAGDPGASIKAWIVYGCNVPLTLPNVPRTVDALSQLEFVVAIDTMPAEITGYADVVLPECTYLERFDDLEASPYRVPYVALRQPVVLPMYDSKPGWWIARQLGFKMGLQAFFPWKDGEEFLRTRVDKSKLDWEALRRDGVIVGKTQPIYDDAPTFKTKSGKIELYSQALADAGLPPLPPYEPPEEPPPGYFRLLFGRAPVHTFSRTTNNPRLIEVMPENELWINAEMARVLGFKHGERVMLENQDSVKTGPIKLKVTERIRQDCVFMVHGFGREDRRLRNAYGKGAADSRLITRVKRDPVMGGTGMNVNFVTVYRAPSREA